MIRSEPQWSAAFCAYSLSSKPEGCKNLPLKPFMLWSKWFEAKFSTKLESTPPDTYAPISTSLTRWYLIESSMAAVICSLKSLEEVFQSILYSMSQYGCKFILLFLISRKWPGCSWKIWSKIRRRTLVWYWTRIFYYWSKYK